MARVLISVLITNPGPPRRELNNPELSKRIKGFSHGPLFWALWILVGSVLWALFLLYMVHNWYAVGSRLGAHTRGP